MKKYTNTTHELRVVQFADGESQFLMRGQSFESDKETKKVQTGIRVVEVSAKKASTKKTTTSDV